MKFPLFGCVVPATGLSCSAGALLAALFFPAISHAAAPERFTVERFPIQVERISPVEVTEKEPGHLFVDFGQVSFGGLELTVPNPQPGQKLTVLLGEALSAPRTVNPAPGGSVRFLSTGVTLQAGTTTYRVPLGPKDGRWMAPQIGPVMPFRYVEIEGAPAGLDKEHIRQLAAHYPFDDGAAQFNSSDPKLNAIWNLCHHTIKATSFAGVFIDGDRERKPYEADAYFAQLGWYSSTPDVTLPRYSWEYLIDHPTWPTEWILFSVLMAWNDYVYTGDTSGLKEFYPDLQAKSLIGLERPDGLISTKVPPVPPAVSEAIHIKSLRDLVDWPAPSITPTMPPVSTPPPRARPKASMKSSSIRQPASISTAREALTAPCTPISFPSPSGWYRRSAEKKSPHGWRDGTWRAASTARNFCSMPSSMKAGATPRWLS